MTIFDKKNKVIILVEGKICNIGQINDRNDYKKRKYLDLRLGLRKLYPDYELKQTNIAFNFLGDVNTTLKKELSDLAHKKDVTKVLTNCQKWIISQKCEITQKILQFKTMKHILFLVQELLPRHCPQQVSKQIVN